MSLDNDGFELIEGVLTPAEISALITATANASVAQATRSDSVYGGRNLLTVQTIATLATSARLLDLVRPCRNARPVRALFFDKTPEANWPVLWHQDLTIALKDRHDGEGWGPWSIKAGIVHVEPPVAILERMLTVRLHLDESGADNGPLRVLPGTHCLGRFKRDRIAELRKEIEEKTCVAPAGSALLMRPLLLHASSPARTPNHRRVIQIEYAPADALPPPLRWAFA